MPPCNPCAPFQVRESTCPITHSGEPPHYRLHFSADAPIAINALLFVPKDNFERLGFGRVKPGVDLYSRKVMIMKQPEDLLPEWMRFVRGVVDSEDLPLNVARETVQGTQTHGRIRRTLTGRLTRALGDLAKEVGRIRDLGHQ